MIAQRIHDGETAEQIGILATHYQQRRETLDRYLAQSGGDFDPVGYLAWLQQDADGDRGVDQMPNNPGKTTPVVGRPNVRKRSCCGGGKIR